MALIKVGVGGINNNVVTNAQIAVNTITTDDIEDLKVTPPKFGGGAMTIGFSVTDFDAGTKSSGTYTPDEADGPFQKAVNGGAHTLAPPSNSTSLVIQYTNNASAGTITTSGFDKVDGDTITTTNTHKFFFYITKSNSLSLLSVKALQ